ncbi:MAG: transmembrane 220 family protein [Cyclobacteriaceae bacterium]|nr:transmembrane 220 family protein [Cyclobacteriaceae bacterium]
MKIIHTIIALMFLSFAALQINDPDPLIWILIYLNMALLSVMGFLGKYNKLWIGLTAGLYLIYAMFLIPGTLEWFHSPDRALLFDDLAKMQYPYIEETRECLGLAICLVVLGFQYLLGRRIN